MLSDREVIVLSLHLGEKDIFFNSNIFIKTLIYNYLKENSFLSEMTKLENLNL